MRSDYCSAVYYFQDNTFDHLRRTATMVDPNRRHVLFACGAAATGLAGCAFPGVLESEQTSEEVSIPAETPIRVTNRNGDVTIEDGGGATATLEIRKSTRYGADLFDQVTVQTGVEDEQFHVETVDDTLPGQSVSVDLTLYLPADVPVDSVRTDNGDVQVVDVPGDATLRTTNGDVRADGVDGFLTLRSGNGDLTARSITGLDGARTINGDIDVAIPSIRGDTRIGTTNGDVRVAVPEDLDAVVELRTTNGDVGVSGLDFERSVDRSRRIRGTLGSGGDELTAVSTNGDVRVRPL